MLAYRMTVPDLKDSVPLDELKRLLTLAVRIGALEAQSLMQGNGPIHGSDTDCVEFLMKTEGLE